MLCWIEWNWKCEAKSNWKCRAESKMLSQIENVKPNSAELSQIKNVETKWAKWKNVEPNQCQSELSWIENVELNRKMWSLIESSIRIKNVESIPSKSKIVCLFDLNPKVKSWIDPNRKCGVELSWIKTVESNQKCQVKSPWIEKSSRMKNVEPNRNCLAKLTQIESVVLNWVIENVKPNKIKNV